MNQSWSQELLRVMGLFFIFLIAGWLTGFIPESMVLFLLAYLGQHLYQIYRLERWLKEGAKWEGEAKGIWGEIYYQLYRQRKSDKNRKKKLGNLLNSFKKSTEALPDAAVVLSSSSDIEWFNKAAEKLLGLKRSDKGEHILNLIRHPTFSAYLYGRDYSSQIMIPSPVNSERELGVRIVSYGDGQRLMVVNDVSQLKQIEKMRSDFVANVSHELKTPLTVLRGYLEMMEEGEPPRQFEKPLRRMNEQANRMQVLVEDLLMIARLESDSPAGHDGEFVNVPALLEKLCSEARVHEECPELILEIDTSSGLHGAPDELESAFGNLIVNAVKYTKLDGKVVVRWSENEQGGRLDVKDTGEGIAARHLPFLTQRFYRVDRARSREQGGTGLGLSIVKHVLSRHQAELKIESEAGQGSLFSCYFSQRRMVEIDGKVVTFL